VARRVGPNGCATATVTASAASFEAAARIAVEKLRAAEEKCPAAAEPLVDAEPIAHPRPASEAGASIAQRRRLRAYEQPWLWAGVIAGAAVVVGLAVGLAPRPSSVRVDVAGPSFSLTSR
jgi:hypothetical protein